MLSRTVITVLASASALFAQLSVIGPGGLVCQMDTARGYIAFGDTSGKKLTFNFNNPWTLSGNFLVFAVDDTGFSNSWGEMSYGYGVMLGLSGISGYYRGSLIRSWNVPYGAGEMMFQIAVTPVLIDGTGMAKVTLFAFNGDSLPHDIGALLGIDIKIGSNDEPRIATGSRIISAGTAFDSETMPFFWQAFESDPGFREQIVARGFLRGYDVNPPEIFAVGDYYYIGLSGWDISSEFLDVPYDDSAILYRWRKVRVNPDKSVEFSTYIGLGTISEYVDGLSIMPFLPSRLSSFCDGFATPFEAAVLINNADYGRALTNLRVCLNIPDGCVFRHDGVHPPDSCRVLELDTLYADSSTIVSWLVHVEDAILRGTSIPIIANFYCAEMPAHSTTTYVEVPNPDGILPVVSMSFPYEYIGCSDTASVFVKLYVHDDSGIDPLSIAFRAGESAFLSISPYITHHGDSVLIELPQRLLIHGDTLELSLLSVSDIFGCEPAEYPDPITAIVDIRPPQFTGFVPPDGAELGFYPEIRLRIVDDVSGVNMSSIELIVDGETIYGTDSRITQENDTMFVFRSTSIYPVGYPFTICFMSAADNVDFCGPHINATPSCATYSVTSIRETGTNSKPPVPVMNVSPSPFNSCCDIYVETVSDKVLTLDIHDITGNVVAKLKGASSTQGMHFVWHPEKCIHTGVYFARVSINDNTFVHRLLYVK